MLLTSLRKEARVAHSPFTTVEGAVAASYFDSDADLLRDAEATVVEDDRLRAHDVGLPEPSQLTAFLDGIQRADIKLHYDTAPIIYAYAAAVVRVRDDRQMRTMRTDGAELVVEREALFYPSRYIPAETLQHLTGTAHDLIDTTPPNSEPLPLFPPLLYARAKQCVGRWREGLEREVALRWCRSCAGWLLIDGGLTISPDVAQCERAVGLIKSHRTRFFDGDESRVMLGLKVGQRTSVFEPQTWHGTHVRSWYLRLRPADRRDVFWGLVRVEVAASHEVAIADTISRWLMSETTPLSLPDARWDRLIYPIHDCEEFLRARAPKV